LANKHIVGKTFEEKLSNLFKEKQNPKVPITIGKEEKKEAKKEETVETPKIVQKINNEILEINKKFNGTIELNESVVIDSNKKPFNPFKIIGFNDFNAYGKQKTEFGDILDQAMYDLLKSIENDKELNIKVLNINTEITDTYKDRLKTYKIKIQHPTFGYTKPYTVSFHVPIPSKGKYLKINGTDWIMINQFHSKPVVKVSPRMVKVYTQFSTCAITIKQHALTDSDGLEALTDTMSSMLKHSKKLLQMEKLSNKNTEDILQKYNLPENIDTGIFINFEIK